MGLLDGLPGKMCADAVNAGDVITRLFEGWDAAILTDSVRAGVVGGKRQVDVLERAKLRQQVPCGPFEVLVWVCSIDAQASRRGGHQLPKSERTLGAGCCRIVTAFSLDQGPEENMPIGS